MKHYIRDIFYYDFETTQDSFGELHTVFVDFENKAVLEVWWGYQGLGQLLFEQGDYKYSTNEFIEHNVSEKFEIVNRKTNKVFTGDDNEN